MSTAESAELSSSPRWVDWFNRVTPIMGVAVFAIAIYFIRDMSRQYSFTQIFEAMQVIPTSQVINSILATIASYAVLFCYDYLAVEYVGRHVSYLRTSVVSFIAFALTHIIGFANIAGNSVRLRMYAHFGLRPPEIIKLILFISFSFWTGFLAVCGFLLIFEPPTPPPQLAFSPVWLQALGAITLVFPIGYFWATVAGWRPKWMGRIPMPTPRMAVLQIVISGVEWILMGLVLYVLLPAEVASVGFVRFLSFFATAQILAFISHVPGGLGVIEATVIYFLVPDREPSAATLGALVAFRIIYYFVPMILAAFGLLAFEGYKSRRWLIRLIRR